LELSGGRSMQIQSILRGAVAVCTASLVS
jgi:hypothetical protein